MTDFLNLFAGAGVAGLCLGFTLWKIVPEMRAMWRAIERMNRVRLMEICISPHAAHEIKEESQEMLREIERQEQDAKRRERIPP